MKNRINKKQFLEWFVGFAEGDGSWQVDNNPKTQRSIFIINQADPKVLYKIKSFFKFGTVKGPYLNKNGSQYYRYRVADLKNTKTLIEVFNGKLILNKTKTKFRDYANFYNSRPTVQATFQEVSLQENSKLPTFNDSWLSGFIDAEGSFSGHEKKRKGSTTNVVIVFSLSQKNEKKVLTYLKILLGGSISNEEKKKVYRLKIEAVDHRDRLIDYISRHPLKSNKAISFSRFRKLHARLTDEKFKWRLTSPRAQKRLIRLTTDINKF